MRTSLCIAEDDTSSLASLFSPVMSPAKCWSSCNDLSRENVKWCVRLADVNKTIETCISLDDNKNLVFESTCDARSLALETYITLPSVSGCCRLMLPSGVDCTI